MLGYKVRGHSRTLTRIRRGGVDWPMRVVASRYDAFRSNPWSSAYRQMDEWFPDSKFVLTVRADLDRWFDSLVNHHARVGSADPRSFVRTEWVDKYLAHTQGVRDHFATRPHQLLELDAEAGDGWAELCTFLGVPAPAVPYPHAYRTR